MRERNEGEECGRGMWERNVGEECGHPSSDIHIDIVVSSLAHSHLRLTKMSILDEVMLELCGDADQGGKDYGAHADAAGGPGHLEALFLWLVAFAGDPMAALADIDAILASCQGEPSTDSVVAFAGGPMAALADNDAVLASCQGEPSTDSGSGCQYYPDGKHLNKNKATPMVNTANTQRHENGQNVRRLRATPRTLPLTMPEMVPRRIRRSLQRWKLGSESGVVSNLGLLCQSRKFWQD